MFIVYTNGAQLLIFYQDRYYLGFPFDWIRIAYELRRDPAQLADYLTSIELYPDYIVIIAG